LPQDRDRSPMKSAITKAVQFRKYDWERIVFVDGGYRDDYSAELFIVPPGGDIPEPSGAVAAPEIPKKGAFQWGSSTLHAWFNEGDPDAMEDFILPAVQAKLDEEQRARDLENEIDEAQAPAAEDSEAEDTTPSDVTEEEPTDSEDEQDEYKPTAAELDEMRFSWMSETFAPEIAKRKRSYGAIIFYADDLYYDIGQIRRFVEEGRDRMAAAAKLDPSRITIIYGGYGDGEVELHIVPKGSADPIPKSIPRPVETPEPTQP
jgi:hypothetical protein